MKGFLEITPVKIPFRANNLPSEPSCIPFLHCWPPWQSLHWGQAAAIICSTHGGQVNPILIRHLRIITEWKERLHLSYCSIGRFWDHHPKWISHAFLKTQYYVTDYPLVKICGWFISIHNWNLSEFQICDPVFQTYRKDRDQLCWNSESEIFTNLTLIWVVILSSLSAVTHLSVLSALVAECQPSFCLCSVQK